MRVGITASRYGITMRQEAGFVAICSVATELHHGNCVGGDVQLVRVLMRHNKACRLIGHPGNSPEWQAQIESDEEFAPKPNLDRNADIVEWCDVLVAAPQSLTEKLRSGTWATIRMARKAGKPVIILDP
jgi:hypothetical protein